MNSATRPSSSSQGRDDTGSTSKLGNLRQWQPACPVRASLLVCHGMAEHGARYARLATALNTQGIAVYAPDLRGHGPNAQHQLGQLPGGWAALEEDLASWLRALREYKPDLPVILLGHSMGSYLAQGLVLQHPALVDALILSGSNAHPPALSRIGCLAAAIEGCLRAESAPAQTLGKLSFGQFNKAFAPNRTEFDWLTRDPAEVDAYIRDPLCGFTLTANYWRGLFTTLLRIAEPKQLARISPELPTLILGGAQDPVSAGKGLPKLHARLQQAGLKRLELRVYPEARHEVFNEINREQITRETLDWILATLSLDSIGNPADENA
ncbi:MAG: alpha/beta hydrolase [Halopseudomonas sp.]|uniref:alpha/beta hydrolase n=1 Tax=Halopseudomonas sp. TaxID=2901191 RepID=UPI003001D7A8